MTFVSFLKKYFGEIATVRAVIDLLEGDENLLPKLLAELEQGINRFNNLREFPEECINARKLKTLLRGQLLPAAISVWDALSLTDFQGEFSKFKFTAEMEDPKQLLGCLLVAVYRTYMLVKYPQLKKGNAQVASSLEEMFAIMALEGQKTQLFEATKHWIMDWEKEGFSKELAERINNL